MQHRGSILLFNAEKLEAKYEEQFGNCLTSIDHAGEFTVTRCTNAIMMVTLPQLSTSKEDQKL